MSVDYRKQYSPDQLEPFLPNEFVKMSVAVLCTLAVIMVFAILPVVLDSLGIHGLLHEQEPANPRGGTPIGIKPEWYFLASYQFLRLMPTEILGIGGKTLGVVSQGLLMMVLATLPFWYRRRASQRPRLGYRLAVTIAIAAFLGLTIWGLWPEEHVDGGERLATVQEFLSHHALFAAVVVLALLVFFGLVALEVRNIRRTLGDVTEAEEHPW
jgi:quinol-cytochrome oxidoreductase complex cytochrome b subunit